MACLCPFLVSVLLQQIKRTLKKLLIELNIFKRRGSDEQQVYYQRMATRCYISILTVSLTILTFYSLLAAELHLESIRNPTESDYNLLEQTYTDQLSCPCTSISMNYSTFVNIEPQYHQVCSSDLVSTEWMNYNSIQNNDFFYELDDYRSLAASYFKLLSTLCRSAKKTVDDALRTYFQAQFVSSRVISRQLFESQVNESINNWQSSTTQRFLSTIQLTEVMHFGNQLLNNWAREEIYMNGDSVAIAFYPIYFNNCSCAVSRICRVVLSIYRLSNVIGAPILLFSIPNFFTGCLPVDSLLQSTLECFYNLSCMIEIDQHVYSPRGAAFNFSALDPNRNWPNEIVKSIVNKLLIDFWNTNISFAAFYKQCAPLICTYEYIGRNNLFSVIVTIIGVVGGLSLGFKIPILVILRLVEKVMHDFSCRGFARMIKNVLICQTEHRIISRLHFIMLVVVLGGIYSFSISSLQSITAQTIEPSLPTYRTLAKQFPDSLQCSCSEVSIKYQSFVDITPRFHHICSSEFVSDRWIEYLNGDVYVSTRFPPTDFRTSATAQFQLLASLCQLSERTVRDSLSQLMTNNLINTQILSSDQLDQQLQQIIDEFQSTTPKVFLNTLNLIREMIGANMLMSMLRTNWKFISDSVINLGWTIHTETVAYGECDCGLSRKCIQPSRGMMVGCYPIEALLQTTLECFYDQQCIDSDGHFPKLNISSLEISPFNMNTTIESMLNHLMVEEYLSNISYATYFSECAPSSCTYSYIGYPSTIDTMTSLISLYGGVVIITQCIAVISTKLWFHCKHRVHPEMTE